MLLNVMNNNGTGYGSDVTFTTTSPTVGMKLEPVDKVGLLLGWFKGQVAKFRVISPGF